MERYKTRNRWVMLCCALLVSMLGFTNPTVSAAGDWTFCGPGSCGSCQGWSCATSQNQCIPSGTWDDMCDDYCDGGGSACWGQTSSCFYTEGPPCDVYEGGWLQACYCNGW